MYLFYFFRHEVLLGCPGCIQILPMSASRAAGTTGTSHLEQFIEKYLVLRFTINIAYKGAVLDTLRTK